MIKITDYKNPFHAIADFEYAVAKYTGAPYVVTTDCCSHAIELCFRSLQKDVNATTIPTRTYLSVLMIFHRLNIPYELVDDDWHGDYKFGSTNIWDSARKLEKNMYKLNQMQCLSFGRTKPLEIGRGGAILLDDKETYNWLKRASYDGRDLAFVPWQDQKEFQIGYHYMMRPEECIEGLNKLNSGKISNKYTHTYPDLRKINVS
jgi:dTDP-4-amino-4,6-dideoxygalactose transaminase